MASDPRYESPPLRQWLREPVLHFFVFGALLFGVQSLRSTEQHTILVTPALRDQFARRLEDQKGREPNDEELAQAVRDWQRDEALYREALARDLDANDPDVRAVLVAKMKRHAETRVQTSSPTDAQLRKWLQDHRERYARPFRYRFQYLAFPRAAAEDAQKILAQLQAGRPAQDFGTKDQPLMGGNMTRSELESRLSQQLALAIFELTPGRWTEIESEQSRLLVRLQEVSGGLEGFESLRPRLVKDWTRAARKRASEEYLDSLVSSYRLEELP